MLGTRTCRARLHVHVYVSVSIVVLVSLGSVYLFFSEAARSGDHAIRRTRSSGLRVVLLSLLSLYLIVLFF